MSESISALSDLAKSFRLGVYQHFKGGIYEALAVARHSEARNEEFVVYRSLAKGYVWVRPLTMFVEHVDRGDYHGPRFQWLREKV